MTATEIEGEALKLASVERVQLAFRLISSCIETSPVVAVSPNVIVPSGDMLTAREAAEYLRTTYKGFDNWVRRHGVRCSERYGRKRMYRKTTLDRVLRMMAIRTR